MLVKLVLDYTYTVITSYSIHYTKLYDGLEKVMKFRPDVVLLDNVMPLLDGLKTLARIMKEQPTPVVIVSRITSYNVCYTKLLRPCKVQDDKEPVPFFPDSGQIFGINL